MLVRFSDMAGRVCELRIGSTATSDAFIYGSRAAFTIEEESSDDISIPVRTQSGNITIVDVEDEWTGLLPGSNGVMPVYLYIGNSLAWCGYVSPSTYGAPFLQYCPQISIPVVCPLRMLSALDYRPSLGHISIASIISDIFQSGDFQTIALNYQITSQDSEAIASLYVLGQSFYTVDDDGNYQPKYSYLEALKHVCTLCGLTARWTGTSVVLEGIPEVGTTPPYLYPTFADTNQDQHILAGWRKVVVEPREDEQNVIFDIPDNSIKNRILAAAGDITFNDYTENYTTTQQNDTYVWVAGYIGGQSVGIELTSPSLLVHADNLNYSNYASAVIVYDRYQAQDPQHPQTGKQSFQWVTAIRLWGPAGGIQAEPCIQIRTVPAFALANGFLVFSAGIIDAYERFDGSGYLVCTLRVGSKYWSGESWVSQAMPFHIAFDQGQIKNNRELSSAWGDYDGFGIFIDGGVVGQVTFTIYGVYVRRTEHTDTIGLTNLNMKFVRKQEYTSGSHRRYIAENSAKFFDTKEISTAFCSDNPAKTLSNVLTDANGTPVGEIEIGQELTTPEQWLAERLNSWGSSARHCLRINVRGNIANVSDWSYNSNVYHCYAASHDYSEDMTTLNLIEI